MLFSNDDTISISTTLQQQFQEPACLLACLTTSIRQKIDLVTWLLSFLTFYIEIYLNFSFVTSLMVFQLLLSSHWYSTLRTVKTGFMWFSRHFMDLKHQRQRTLVTYNMFGLVKVNHCHAIFCAITFLCWEMEVLFGIMINSWLLSSPRPSMTRTLSLLPTPAPSIYLKTQV